MKNNILFWIIFIIILISASYYIVELVNDSSQGAAEFDNVYTQAKTDNSQQSTEKTIQESVIKEVVRIYKVEKQRTTFSDAELIELYKKNK